MRTVFLSLIGIVCFTGWTAGSDETSNNKPTPAEFHIGIDYAGDEFILTCKSETCNWAQATFSADPFEIVSIDGQGVAIAKKRQTRTGFLFHVVSHKDDVLKLVGVKGTAWSELSFRLYEGEKQVINQYGMVD